MTACHRPLISRDLKVKAKLLIKPYILLKFEINYLDLLIGLYMSEEPNLPDSKPTQLRTFVYPLIFRFH